MYLVSVDNDKCDGCEECVNACPQMVFKITDGKSDPYQAGECVFCETCLSMCPNTAITITEI